MCKVSIIIPCYNVEQKLIQRCMLSIDAQTFTDYEVILVDDGSNSTYSSYLLDIEQKYNRATIYRQENKGVSAARNLGLTKAKGEYVVYIDADDYLTPEYLEEATKVAEDYNAEIVIGLNSTTYSTDINEHNKATNTNIKVYSDEEVGQLNRLMLGKVQYYYKNAYLGQGPWNRMVCRQLAIDTPFDETLPIGEDIVWNLQLLQKAKKVCLVDHVWYMYYVSPTSSSRKHRENAIDESYRSLIKIRDNLDLNDDQQYLSYCLRCWSDLKRIFRCYLSQNSKVNHHQEMQLYKNDPWNELSKARFLKIAGRKGWFMWTLYVSRCMFAYYRLKSHFFAQDIDK